jgi:hypothetical protein
MCQLMYAEPRAVLITLTSQSVRVPDPSTAPVHPSNTGRVDSPTKNSGHRGAFVLGYPTFPVVNQFYITHPPTPIYQQYLFAKSFIFGDLAGRAAAKSSPHYFKLLLKSRSSLAKGCHKIVTTRDICCATLHGRRVQLLL